jgi:hypothetical protein
MSARHAFGTRIAEFADGSLQVVAYCARCTLIVPVGAHFLQPCVETPSLSVAASWPTPRPEDRP